MLSSFLDPPPPPITTARHTSLSAVTMFPKAVVVGLASRMNVIGSGSKVKNKADLPEAPFSTVWGGSVSQP